MSSWSLGCDPEIFALDAKGKPTPVFGLIGGTKDNPMPFDARGNRIMTANRNDQLFYQEDGAAIEFNIPECSSINSFALNVRAGVEMCQLLLRRAGLSSSITPVVEFTEQQLSHPYAQNIGCVSDMQAYTKDGDNGYELRNPFSAESFGRHRFAGGHIHIGYNKGRVPAWVAARFADVYLGLPSLRFDKQGLRRKFYGDAGIFREKDYGIEYRTLSPLWMENWARISRMAACAANFARALHEGYSSLAGSWETIDWERVRKTIQEEDLKTAAALVKEYGRILPFYDQASMMITRGDEFVEPAEPNEEVFITDEYLDDEGEDDAEEP